MSPDLAALLESRGIRRVWGGRFRCDSCDRYAEKWNHIEHHERCANKTLVAERYAEVESRPKTPSNSMNPNVDSGHLITGGEQQ